MTSSDSFQSSSGVFAPAPRKAWRAALGELQLQLTADIYEMYLHPTRFLAYEDGTFLVAVPNGFVKDWLEVRLNRVVKRTLQHIMNRAVEIKYMVQPPAARDAEPLSPAPLLEEPSFSVPAADRPNNSDSPVLSADYTFGTFIVGANNRMAHAAAMSVADQPGNRYNPLFLYSGVGLGKTHLMHAIGHRARHAGHKAVYVSCEVFTNELVAAIRTNTQEQFRAKYRTSDLLLLDDIQFLAGKPSTQEELFHTFNALHESGRQIVLACDRPPNAMSTLEKRLRSRFQWGLIADIQPPDLEMRLAILQAKAASHDASLTNDVLEVIAHLVPTNVREMEGALTKVLAHGSLNPRPLTADDVKIILMDMMPIKAQVEPDVVITMVARVFGFGIEQLAGASRKKELVRARQVAMYLLREELELSYPNIGQLLGGRDHATAMHSVRRVAELLEKDDDLKRQVDRLREQLLRPVPVPVRVRM